jgi:hypothetical protein
MANSVLELFYQSLLAARLLELTEIKSDEFSPVHYSHYQMGKTGQMLESNIQSSLVTGTCSYGVSVFSGMLFRTV